MRLRLGVFALVLIPVIACGDDGVETGFFINVGLQNSWTDTLDVLISGGSDGVRMLDIPPGYTSTEIAGSSGQTLLFNAQGLQSDGPLGGGLCTSTNAIVGRAEYGQVTFLVSGDDVLVECSTGWLESIIP